MGVQRVLVLITEMNRGGAEAFLMNYYRHFDRSVIQFDFVVNRADEGVYEDEIQGLGGRIYRMPPMYPQYFAQYKHEFRHFLLEHPEYKVIHSNLEERSYFPLRIARELGVPVRISHAHSELPGLDSKTVFRQYFKFRLPPYPTDYFACSLNAGRALYGSRRLQSARFRIFRNAIDLSVYRYDPDVRRSMRSSLGLDGRIVIGSTARLAKFKNQSFLLDIFARIRRDHENAVLLLAGDGPCRTALESKAQQLGISDSVKFVGTVSNVPAYLQAMDAFVLPSLSEGLPTTLIEAQAAGLPCVVSDKVTREAIVTDNCRYLSLKSDVAQWEKSVLAGLERPRKDCSDQVRAHGYDVDTEAGKLQDFYISSLSRRQ